jgi:hypothetical protein
LLNCWIVCIFWVCWWIVCFIFILVISIKIHIMKLITNYLHNIFFKELYHLIHILINFCIQF